VSYHITRIYAKTGDESPLEGVLVRLYPDGLLTLFDEGTTDSAGVAEFLLPAGTYQVRVYRPGVTFPRPVSIVVTAPGAFDVIGAMRLLETPTNPRLCRVGGYILRANGEAARGVPVDVALVESPRMIDENLYLQERQRLLTDNTGWIETSLLRCHTYSVRHLNFDETLTRTIYVPDVPSFSWNKLVMSRIEQVLLSPAGPYELAAGQELLLDATRLYTDLRRLAGVTEDVYLSSSNPVVMSVTPEGTKVRLRALTAGSASVLATRYDSTIVHIPNTPVAVPAATVTVT
jgi:hypothetical protein